MALSSYLPTTQDRSKAIENLSRDCNVPKENIYDILGVYITILGMFLQSNDNEYSEKMIEIGFTKEFLEQLSFLGHRQEIIGNLQNSFNTQKLGSLKWRIDISLGNRYSIILQLLKQKYNLLFSVP